MSPFPPRQMSPRLRKLQVKRLELWGTVTTRKREDKEPCPLCNGKYDNVYQYTEDHRGMNDDRWFCLCGYTESPDESTTLEQWREP